jgi:hypothetical protein
VKVTSRVLFSICSVAFLIQGDRQQSPDINVDGFKTFFVNYVGKTGKKQFEWSVQFSPTITADIREAQTLFMRKCNVSEKQLNDWKLMITVEGITERFAFTSVSGKKSDWVVEKNIKTKLTKIFPSVPY